MIQCFCYAVLASRRTFLDCSRFWCQLVSFPWPMGEPMSLGGWSKAQRRPLTCKAPSNTSSPFLRLACKSSSQSPPSSWLPRRRCWPTLVGSFQQKRRNESRALLENVKTHNIALYFSGEWYRRHASIYETQANYILLNIRFFFLNNSQQRAPRRSSM